MHVLVITTDRVDVAPISTFLRACGHAVNTVRDLGEATGLPDASPDLVVCTAGVGPDGLEALRRSCQDIAQHFGHALPYVLAVVTPNHLWSARDIVEAGADDAVCTADTTGVLRARLQVAESTLRHRRRQSMAERGSAEHNRDPLAPGVGSHDGAADRGRAPQGANAPREFEADRFVASSGEPVWLPAETVVPRPGRRRRAREASAGTRRTRDIDTAQAATPAASHQAPDPIASEPAVLREGPAARPGIGMAGAGAIDPQLTALRDIEAAMRAILDTVFEGIIVVDDREHIEVFSAGAEHIFGYREDEVRARDIRGLMPAPFGGLAEHRTSATRAAEPGGPNLEVIGRHRDGSALPLAVSTRELQLHGRRAFVIVVRDLRDRRKLEQEVLQAAGEERERIGRDLHDGLCSHLTGVAMLCRSIARGIERGRVASAEEVSEVASLIQESVRQARRLASGMAPVSLSERGLASALADLVASTEMAAGFPVRLVCEMPVLPLEPEVTLQLYRIAQEALQNALKHAEASEIIVSLGQQEDELVLSIRDDGRGMGNQAESDGMGLRIMRYRASMIGASLTWDSSPAGGTAVSCRLPLQDSPSRL